MKRRHLQFTIRENRKSNTKKARHEHTKGKIVNSKIEAVCQSEVL